jgi:hypothetical protein
MGVSAASSGTRQRNVIIAASFFLLRHLTPYQTAISNLSDGNWLIEDRTLGPLRLLDFLGLLITTGFIIQRWGSRIAKLRLCHWFAYFGRHQIFLWEFAYLPYGQLPEFETGSKNACERRSRFPSVVL